MTTLTLKRKVSVPFPSLVTGTGGIKVVKSNGIWTISPDFAALGTISGSAVTDPSQKQIWIWDPVTGQYNVLTLGGLGDALYKLTSTTSVLIGAGAKTFATQANKDIGVGSWLLITSDALPNTNYMVGQVTSYDASGNLAVNVTAIGGAGTFADWTIRVSGPTGATGATGSTAGIKQAYSSTTADADPGNGTFRLNNATPASATAAYLDNLDSGGATVSGIFDLWDDSTTTTKGYVRFQKSTDPTVWAQFAVTGSVVDGTGYRKLTLTSGAGSGAFTNADAFVITFARSGDKGTDGAGTGDFSSNTATSVDGEAVVFSGTLGKTGKRFAGTGGVKAAAGVLSVDAQLTSNLVQNSRSAAYTTVLTDGGGHILHPAADNNARTFTIDSNANVAYPIGTTLTFVNQINTVTLAITSDTLTMAGTGSTGSRTLAASGMATALKIAATSWIISGTGLS